MGADEFPPWSKYTHSAAAMMPPPHEPMDPKVSPKANGDVGKSRTNGQVITICENPLSDGGVEKATEAGTIRVHLVQSPVFRRRTTLEKCLLLSVSALCFACAFLLYITLTVYLKTTALKTPEGVCLTEECVKTAASLLSGIDKTADPCEDFFQYACGSWNKLHVIPEDRSSVSTFEVLADELKIILKGLLDEPISEIDNNATKKAKLYTRSCLNTTRIEEINDAPLKKLLMDLGGWPVATPGWKPPPWPIETLVGRLRGEFNMPFLVEQWVGPDDMNSEVNIIQLDQMNFGLTSRDYFLKSSSQRELNAYLTLMIKVATKFGANTSTVRNEMKRVLGFEISLANASLAEADRHDTGSIYKKLTLRDLQMEVPEINWLNYFNVFLLTTIDENEPIVVYAMPYLKEMGKIIAKTDREIIHNYILWRFVNELIQYLGEEYQKLEAEFRKVMWGISAEKNRWNQCIDLVNKRMGMAVGSLFIRDNFNHESKETALEMIHNIREAFNELLEENDWMDDETREVARAKANAMNERIGYPEYITNSEELSKEYENLEVHEDLLIQNVLNSFKCEASNNIIKLRQPVNKNKWNTEPAVVNAFYNPNKNDIVFPAGILQPLFYSQHFPKSLNYGGIGVVIGHEITHGFDDKGRQFDKNGNLKQWWNNSTIKAFRDRAQCIVDQYSSYVLEEVGLPINGKLTQGENIADNGGLKQAFRAYKKWVAKNGEEQTLPGVNLTHDQLFFLNYAQIWCGSMRPEDALSKIRSSVHSPGPIRVLGPLSNSFDFARAYNCAVGSKMNPAKKCMVW